MPKYHSSSKKGDISISYLKPLACNCLISLQTILEAWRLNFQSWYCSITSSPKIARRLSSNWSPGILSLLQTSTASSILDRISSLTRPFMGFSYKKRTYKEQTEHDGWEAVRKMAKEASNVFATKLVSAGGLVGSIRWCVVPSMGPLSWITSLSLSLDGHKLAKFLRSI